MKGVVFVALAEMIQNKYGHQFWNNVVSKSELESEGVYTAAATYKDEEANKLLASIASKLDKKSNDVLKIFGIYLAGYFNKKYPQFFSSDGFFDFLASVDNIVHVEIKKLSPDSTPPKIQTIKLSEKEMTLLYFSKRKLCPLAIGLIKGSSHIYGINVDVEHTKCMHDGHEFCEFFITIK
jgi:predicted hydrocarbon binding protein